jgi:WD40 repeat protein/transcriptional regulator with XRE-family HTH domain
VDGTGSDSVPVNSLNAMFMISTITLMATRSNQTGTSSDAPVGDHRRLHDLLVELRHRAGDPSLRKINSGCGVSVGYLSQIFAGKTAPGPDVAVRVAQALKATEREQARVRFYAEGVGADRSAPRTADTSRPRRQVWDGCPYLGLRPFEEQHAPVFYGRRALTGRLLDRLREHPPDAGMLLVLGPSGAGKSSLLRAGLMGALADDGLAPGSGHWPRRVITPGSDPVRQLAILLAELAATDAISVREALIARPGQAYLLAGQALTAAGTGDAGTGPQLVLVVDQLEELFTLAAGTAEQETFLTALHSLATEPVLPDGRPGALVVAGIRGDFLDRALAFTPVRNATEAGPFTVGAMSESELREAVAGPAAEAGVRIPDELCTAILDDLRERSLPAGFDCGALPLLSQAMFVMWQNRDTAGLTVAGYHRTGGVAGIVHTSAEQVYESLGPDGQEAARCVFSLLTATTDGRLTRRPGTRDSLRAAAGSDRTDEVVEAFAAQRLLTVSDSDTVTIAHEELLRSWDRLRDWLEPDVTDRVLYRALTDDVHDWQQRRRDPSYLYRGSRLVAVDDALHRWAGDPARNFPVDPAATEFLHASRRRDRRRRRAYRAVAAVMVLLMVLSGAVAVLAEHQRALALSRQLAAQSATLLPRNPELADLLAVQAYRISDTAEAADSLYTAVSQPIVRTLTAHTDMVSEVAFSRDGRYLASAGYDATVWVWDLRTGTSRALNGHADAVSGVAFSADGQQLASSSHDRTVRVWNVATGESLALKGHDEQVSAVAFAPKRHQVASAGSDGTIRIWDLDTGRSRTLTGPSGTVLTVAYNPDGRQLAGAGTDKAIRIWDLDTGRSRTLGSHQDKVTSVAYSPDGHLASASRDRTVRVWDLATGGSHSLKGHEDTVSAVAYSPRGDRLVSASHDRKVRVWDVGTWRSYSLDGHTSDVYAVAFSSDMRRLASAGYEGTVRVWDLATGRSHILEGHHNDVYSVAYSRNGHHLASAGRDSTVRVWDLATGDVRVLKGHTEAVYGVAYSPDERSLATSGSDGTVRIWDLATGVPRTLADHDVKIHSVVHSRDGRLLAGAGYDRTVRVWNVTTGQEQALTGHTDKVHAVAFSPDGRHLASAGYDGTVRVWEHASGRSRTLEGHTDRVHAVAFSSDQRHLASASRDGTVRVWDLSTGEASVLKGHDGQVHAVAFSPDRRHLASAGSDRTVRVWDLIDGTSHRLTGHTNAVYAVAYTGDGHHLASAAGDGTVRVWANAGLTPAAAIALICGSLGRDLTPAERRTYLSSAWFPPKPCPRSTR